MDDFKTTYTSEDDIISDFFRPAFLQFKNTKICSAYFSSAILIDLFDEIDHQLSNGGTFQLIIGADTNPIELKKMQTLALGSEGDYILEKVFGNISLEHIEKYKILMKHIRNHKFSIKVGKTVKTNACFHNKLYLFHNSSYEMGIAASGSLNFTHAGIYDNYENIILRESLPSFIESMKEFEKLWVDSLSGTTVETILDYVINEIDYQINIQKEKNITNENLILNDFENNNMKSTKQMRQYQIDAINSFFGNNMKGILSMATGSGKTFTAIKIIEKLTQETKAIPIICVPYKVLAEQWKREINEILPDKNILVCNSENPNWSQTIGSFLRIPEDKIIIVVDKTYTSEKFINSIKNYIEKIFLVVDEAHNFKSEKMINENYHNFPYRLALSATPFYDDEDNPKDVKFKEYFSGVIFEFSLKDAINQEFLVPYKYLYTHVNLDVEEYKQYNTYSSQIAGLIERGLDASALLTKRNSILANCINKLEKFKNLCECKFYPSNTIIYCGKGYSTKEENKRVIAEIADLIVKYNRSILVQQFTSEERPDERIEIMNNFTNGRYDFLTAMKCLDEGVDIPEVSNVVILASDNTKREWVQRRGRVLRRAKGKKIASIYDFIVCDPNGEILIKEDERKKEFIKLAKEVYEY